MKDGKNIPVETDEAAQAREFFGLNNSNNNANLNQIRIPGMDEPGEQITETPGFNSVLNYNITEKTQPTTEKTQSTTEKTQSIIDKAQEKARKRIEENQKKISDLQKQINTESVINCATSIAMNTLDLDTIFEDALEQSAKLQNIDLSTINKPDIKSFRNHVIRKYSAKLGLYDELLREKNEYIKMLQSAETPEQLKKFKEQMGKGRVKKPLDMDLIKDLKAKKISNRKIAELLGVSETCIRNRLKEI